MSQWKWPQEWTADAVASSSAHLLTSQLFSSFYVFYLRFSILQLWRWRSPSQRFQSRHPSAHVRRLRPTTISARTNQLLPGEHGVSVVAPLQRSDRPTQFSVPSCLELKFIESLYLKLWWNKRLSLRFKEEDKSYLLILVLIWWVFGERLSWICI